jgi:mutator protein MutT/HAD superfamily hydrolase (TIGR01509 family)
MNKAFIFDLDGVLISNEQTWENEKQRLYQQLFGPAIAAKMGSTQGINMDGIYERATGLGASLNKRQLTDEFFKLAPKIYETSPIPKGTVELVRHLKSLGYHLAVVSASPLSWVAPVMHRLPCEDDFELILSLHERPDLAHKPKPDGYLEALRLLGSSGGAAFALEDSNPGIAAAKAAGLFTIGFTGNLVDGYRQSGADAYAQTMDQVLELVKTHQAIFKASGIIIRDRKVLVEKSFGKEYFIHPGGKLEVGERPKQALVRELKEEFQITVAEQDLIPFDKNSAPAANNPESTVHMEVFLVSKWEGELTPAREVEQIRWLTSDVPPGLKVGSIMKTQTIPKLKAEGLID